MRVLVTTERRDPLAGLLAARGASVLHVPLIETVPLQTPRPQASPALALVTSAATVRHARDLARLLRGVPVVAVGAKTAEALERVGVVPVAVGTRGGAAAVALLAGHAPRAAVLHIGAETLSTPLDHALGALARPVERWVVYRRQTPQGLSLQLGAAAVDAVAFASGSAARTFARHWVGPVPAVAVLGPTTAQEAAEAGLPVHAQAAHPTLEALAEAVVRLSPSGPG